MTTYRFPEEGLCTIVNHIPAYAGVTLTSMTLLPDHIYEMITEGEIPESELPHLIEGAGLEVVIV